ncbi:SusC/RagA family TonB-linked outer membrane protein [Fulvivirga ligni]|uniref:SusC/RagA family TonB-linked outer membrane protein n=1 Tax=Fulvivirga ligni TaxID=2904246 RepID=UPI001F3A5ADA|nr:TonB-dependent receptor [Fulvivirga ligni]UII19901.1 TonB-dependent receptor [Fulvivirga ligni]
MMQSSTPILKVGYARLCMLILLMSIATISFAQNPITGKITDESGAALPGASVLIKDSSKGTVTDINGNYTLTANSSDILIVSFIGYKAREIAVGSQTSINVSLSLDTQQLTEVVVVGYGTQKRADVTGAISTVEADELANLPVPTVDQALQGRAAGVTVINNGAPGNEPTIRIRGLGTVNNNNPLYVIDGVIATGLGDLNPQDIESMQVLKDASTAAVYGAKGSNGVIIVTTKKGKSGKVQVSMNAYAGSQWSNKRFDLLNSQQYLTYAKEAFQSPPRVAASDTIPAFAQLLQNNTDWQDQIFQSGLVQNYSVGVSGGGDNSTFRISGGYLSQEGIIRSTNYERYNLRANSNFKLGKLTVGENVNIAISEENPLAASGGRSVIEHTIKMAPYLPVYDSRTEGGYRGPNTGLDAQDAENPVRVLELGRRERRGVALLGNVFAELEIIDGLKARSQVGSEYKTFEYSSFTPSYNDDPEGATHTVNYANIRLSDGSLFRTTFTNSLSYSKSINKVHNIEVLALSEQVSTRTTLINTYSRNYISNDVDQVSNTDSDIGSSEYNYYRLGYLGRINYNYDERYMIAASFRRDASSRFASSNRWGSFPSAAIGWNISKEGFMDTQDFVSNLKLRASWGKTGNDNIPDYSYSAGIVDDFHYPIGGSDALGASPAGLGNSNLKWEETTMSNIGLDFAIMDYTISGSIEYYSNQSDDLLIPRVLPISSGFNNGTVIENTGSIETKGIEINLGYNHTGSQMEWSVNANLGTSKNEVLDVGENEAIVGANFESENISYSTVGQPAFQFYGWQFDGIFDSDAEANSYMQGSQYNNLNARGGDFRIVDTNNDGRITADDRTIIGNPFPTLTYGLSANLNYKGFDVSLFFNGMYGNDIYNTNIYDLEGMPRLFNAGTGVLDRWTPENNTADEVPRAGGAGTNVQVSSRFVEDGSYTRLRNITLGYNLLKTFKIQGMSKFRVYVTGMNLLTFTNYSGLDPEVGASNDIETNEAPAPIGAVATDGNGQPITNFENGIDRGNYPAPKSIVVGIEITL